MPIAPLQRLFPAILVMGLMAAGAAVAKEPDHEAVRRAVERGDIRPLAEILALVRAKLPGDVIATELEEKKGRWLYEFRLAAPTGGIRKIYVDAKTGEITHRKER